MIKLILFLTFISGAYMREKPADDRILETYFPVAELFPPENGYFMRLEKRVKAIVEGPYVEIQSIYTYQNPTEHLLEAKFEFPQSENDIFQKVEIKHENQGIAQSIFDEVNSPNREYDRENLDTKERFSYREVQAGTIKANETVEVIFRVMRPLKVQLSQFYELGIRPYETPRFTPFYMTIIKNYNIQIELKSERPFDILANPTHYLQPEISNHTDSLSGIKTYKVFYNATMKHVTWYSEKFKIYFASSEFNAPQRIMATHPLNPQNHTFMFSMVPDMKYFSSWGLDTRNFQQKAQSFLRNLDDPENFFRLKTAIIRSELENSPNEYLFMIDRSDSVKEFRIKHFKKTFNELLGVLSGRATCFSILSFGKTFELYGNNTQGMACKTPEEIREIMKWIEALEADMGEKDLLSALKYAFEEHKWTSLPKNVIILTGGNISNINDILELVQANSHSQKVCSVGDGFSKTPRKIGKAGGCPIELAWGQERPLNIIDATLKPPEFKLAYEITCENEENLVVHQEEGQFDGIPKHQAFTKWFTLNNIPNLKSCKAKIFYYSEHRCFSSAQEIEIFTSQEAQVTDTWHKVAHYAKLHHELQSEESKLNLIVNAIQEEKAQAELTNNEKSRSLYDFYQEQFHNLQCENFTRKEEDDVDGFFSLQGIWIALIFPLIYVVGLLVI